MDQSLQHDAFSPLLDDVPVELLLVPGRNLDDNHPLEAFLRYEPHEFLKPSLEGLPGDVRSAYVEDIEEQEFMVVFPLGFRGS